MKKISVLLISLLVTFCVAAAPRFQEGKQYIVLDNIPDHNNLPDVLEFFSFYCPHCYIFDQEYHVSDSIEKSLPEGIKLTRYHVSFLGALGEKLTRAWAVAVELNVEKEVLPLLFKAVQNTQTLSAESDIRKIFLEKNITQKAYDAAQKSLSVKNLIEKQENAAVYLKLQGVPAVFVKGKYMIRNEGIDASSKEAYAKEYAQVVKFLLNLNQVK